jgi:hypothetical protein
MLNTILTYGKYCANVYYKYNKKTKTSMPPSSNAFLPDARHEQSALPISPEGAIRDFQGKLSGHMFSPEGDDMEHRRELREIREAHWATLGPIAEGIENPRDAQAPRVVELPPGNSTRIELDLDPVAKNRGDTVMLETAGTRLLRPESYGLWGAAFVDVFGNPVGRNDVHYPVAYLVYKEGGRPTRIEMVAFRQSGGKGPMYSARYCLYDPAALNRVYTRTNGESLTPAAGAWGEGRVWSSVGNTQVPESSVPEHRGRVTFEPMDSRDKVGITITNHQNPNSGSTVEIVRATPTAKENLAIAEAQSAPEIRKPGKIAKIARWVGAGLLGLTVLSSVQSVDAFSPGQREVANAGQLISPSRADLDAGLPRLASLYEGYEAGQQELARATDSLNAYLRGDKQRLLEIQQENNYHANWVPGAAIHKIEQASSIEELQLSFSEAVQGTNVDLQLYTGDGTEGIDRQGYDEQHTVGVDDLANMRKTAIAALNMLNLYDKRGIGDLHIVLVKDIESTGKDRPEGTQEAGYYNPVKTSSGKTTIVLDVSYASGLRALDSYVGGGNIQGTAEHEYGHFANDKLSGDLSRDMVALSPPTGNDEPYFLGFDEAQNSDTKVRGIQVARDSYDRTDSDEAAAVSAQDVEGLSIDKSTASIKSLAVLMREDEKQPGLMAAMLSRMKGPYRAPIWEKATDGLTRAMKDTANYRALAMLTLFGVAMTDVGARRTQRFSYNRQLRQLRRQSESAG